MADTKTNLTTEDLPDWWQREKRQRQTRTLLFLGFILLLIVYYYYVSASGIGVQTPGVPFDSTNYIVFVRQEDQGQNKGQSSLYAVRADGTDLRRLSDVNDKSQKFAPSWTLDGKNVLYVSDRNDGKTRQIYMLGNGDPSQLTYGTGNKDTPIASPDKEHVGFVTQGAIKTVYLNGNDVYQQIPPPRSGNEDSSDKPTPGEVDPQGPFLNAAFSSDGKGIAGVQALTADDNNMMSMGGAGLGDEAARALPANGTKALTLDSGREVSVSWEPNGSRLACSFTEFQAPANSADFKDNKPHLVHGITLYTFTDPNKPTRQPLLASIDHGIEPKNIAWSPDGKNIAFEGWYLKGDGDRELRGIIVLPVMNKTLGILPSQVDSVRYMVPASAQGKPQHPHWSPDGSRLVYEMARPQGGTDLWVVDTDGTNPINLTKGQGNNTQAAWSPLLSK